MSTENKNTKQVAGTQVSATANVRLPWEKGDEGGWENFSNFQEWFAEKFVECDQYDDNEEWIDSCPTFLILVFQSFAEEILMIQQSNVLHEA